MINIQICANRLFPGNEIPGKKQRLFFLIFSIFCAIIDTAQYYIVENPTSPVSPISIIILTVLLFANGWLSPWTDILFIAFFATFSFTDLSDNLGFFLFAVIAIFSLWIYKGWFIQTVVFFVTSNITFFINSRDTFAFILFFMLEITLIPTLGFLLRWQRSNTETLQNDLATLKKEAEAIGVQVRRELAAQLHDTTAKDLARVAIFAQHLRDSPEPVTKQELSALAELATTASRRIRPTILSLDSTRTNASLEKAVQESRKMLTARDITLEVVTPEDLDSSLTRQQKIVAALTVRESATNILKYAPENSTARLEVELDSDQTLYISIQNDVATKAASGITGGFGLRNLEDQINQEGGTLLFGKTNLTWNLNAEIPFKTGENQ